MVVFITLGSQKFQFNRLLQAVDEQIADGKIVDEVFAQIGASDYKPQHYRYKDFLSRDEFSDWQSKSDIVITHGGTGAIIGALKKGKKVIAVPRLAMYGEHVDDHQLQLIAQFKELNLIRECLDCDELYKALEEVKETKFNSYESNTSRIIESIESFIENKNRNKVLMVGNDHSVNGGITTVINQLLGFDWSKREIEMRFIPTYIDSGMINKVVFFAKSYQRIRHEIKKNSPDIVHIHMSYKGSFYRKKIIHNLCRRHGIPDIIHLHGSEFKKWYDESKQKKKEQIKTLLRECSAVIVLGEKWNKAVKEIEPLTKTIILNNTVCMQKATVRWNQPFRVLYLGVLVKRKGVDDLLKAISLLSSFISADCVQFIIAGSGQEEESLKQYSAKLGINNYIQFLGWIDGDQKKEIMKNSQMLVLPSYNEGLPMSVLEAISYGMPIVSTDVGDVSSVVHDGENGFLIQPGGVEQLKNRLMLLITNKDLYEKMSLKSKIIANASFSDKAYFDTIYTLYKDLIKTGGN